MGRTTALVVMLLLSCGAPALHAQGGVDPLSRTELSADVAARVRASLDQTGTGMAVAAMLNVAQMELRAVAERFEALRPGSRARADSAAAGIAYMLEQWTPESELPDEYRADLARAVDMLRLARQAYDPGDAYLLWSNVVEDLEIKAEHCRELGIGLGGLVAVTAHTLRDTLPDAGWQVVYLPKLLEVLPDAEPQPFPRLSSPSSDSLAPGRYWVWARRPGTADRSERVLVKVGAGRTVLDIDIPLPRPGGDPAHDDVDARAATPAAAPGGGRR